MTVVTPELYDKLRQLESQGVSQRQIGRILGLARVTVRKYLEGGCLPGRMMEPRRNEATNSKANPNWEEAIDNIIHTEKKKNIRTRKQRLNAASIHRELDNKGIQISERSVRRYISAMKEDKKTWGQIEPVEPVDLILDFKPGEVMQVDWCEVKIVIQGQVYTAPIFCAALSYSYNIFCMIFPNMKVENFIEGHVKAFEFFNGVPKKVFYDNLKAFVLKNWGKDAVKQEKLLFLESHYLFKSFFMNRAKGNEKGSVENLCKIAESNFFTPIPEGNSLKEINNNLLAKIIKYDMTHQVSGKTGTINERYNEEKNYLHKLPIKPFYYYKSDIVTVRDNSTIEVEKNKYSVPEEYVKKSVTYKIKPYDIEVWYHGKLIYSHERCIGKNKLILIPYHFLNTLRMKPRALNNAAVLKNYNFSDIINQFLSFNTESDRNYILIEIMTWQKEVGEEKVDKAILEAINKKQYDINKLIDLLKVNNKNKYKKINSADINVPEPDLSKYEFKQKAE
jgi:transposase